MNTRDRPSASPSSAQAPAAAPRRQGALGYVGLRAKLFIAFLIVTFVPLIGLSLVNYWTVSNTNAVRAGASLQSVADLQSLAVGDFLARQLDKLQSWALDRILRDGVSRVNALYAGDRLAAQAQLVQLEQRWKTLPDTDPLVQARLNNDMVDALRRYREAFADNLELVVIDQYGGLVAATSRPARAYYALKEEWVAAYNGGRGGVYINMGTAAFDEFEAVKGVVIAVPIYSIDNRQVIGVLRTTYRLKGLTDLLASGQVGHTGRSELLLPDNQLITLQGVGAPLATTVAQQVRVLAGAPYGEMVYGEIPSLVSLGRVAEIAERAPTATNKPITDLGWQIVVHQDRSEAFEASGPLLLNTAILVVVALGIVTLSGFLTAQVLTRPIVLLTRTVQQIAGGDLEVQAAVETRDEIGSLASAFNAMTDQLKHLIGNLEQRVADRTADLERRSAYLRASAEVGGAAASILDSDQLARQVVDSIRSRFDLYYVGLFMVDAARQWAVLRAGTGEAGQAMLARAHRLPVGESSMIGWCIANAQARIALRASEDVVRAAMSELPLTRSEAALPLRSRGQVLGALTVQSAQPDAFDTATLSVLQIMADQVAVALDNARLFAESQSALEAVRRAYGEQSRRAWMDLLASEAELGYRGDARGIVPVQEPFTPEMEQALQTGRVAQAALAQGKLPVAVPILLHGQAVAVMSAAKAGELGQWTQSEISFLQSVAEQLGLALESARLYQDTQRRAALERLTAQVSGRMRESLDMDMVLKTAAQEIRLALRLPEVGIRLTPPGNGELPGKEASS